ncbi:MAG: argininosuccinate lyase [Deltaproteobacteria bacterium CG11_big_fil_rev_8_21_14_0_20_47_16]|nr:MAG: argininosuccinate lyase [Deltaproteobacteria bacterium CG11_big_fil_rev_8_21_14_0_20_47_16]
MTLWHGRFEGTMSDVMQACNHSLPIDIRLLPYDLRVNRAWANALCNAQLLTPDEVKAIEKGLQQISEEHVAGKFFPLPNDEDVHSLVERRLTELIGNAGKKIHTGRSRNDQVATDFRLYLKEAVAQLCDTVRDLGRALAAQAESHITTVMPGYTHMQQAQPITLAHYLLGFVSALEADFRRLQNVAKAVDECPLGSGAIAGAAFPIDRAALAKNLGFSRPTINSLAATSQRDEALELASTLSIIMVHLSRYAEDWITYSTKEFGYLRMSDAVTTGSSMMPQKKNPDAMELIRGKASRVIGDMQTLFTLVKGLPLHYAKDLQEDKPALFDAIDQTLICLKLFTESVATAQWNTERMAANLDPLLFATDVADYLTSRGIPFRAAHAVVGKLVQDAITQNKSLSSYTLPELQKFCPDFEKEVVDCFNVKKCLDRRNLIGGTGPLSVQAQIKHHEKWL